MHGPYFKLVRRLNQISPGDLPKVPVFANGGAEAVEDAVKLARCAVNRPTIVCLENAFHDRTFPCMSLTSKIKPFQMDLLGCNKMH